MQYIVLILLLIQLILLLI